MIRRIAVCVCLFWLAQAGLGAVWFVAPDGRADNTGRQASPWDIASCLEGKHDVVAGDTVFLLEGTYRRRPRERFEIRLVGTAGNPVHIRSYPNARVRIDGGLEMHSPSAHVWIWNLEIFVSEPTPTEPVEPGSHPESFTRPWGGMNMFGGRNCKYINLVIHDTRQGISCWSGEIDPEIYGCIIYGNGWLGTDRGHGHCIYTQNKDGVKTISNCIMTCKYDGTYTMHAYGSSRAYVDNFLATENIVYGKGPFLIGGGRPSNNIRVVRNYLHGVSMRIGYNAPFNENCEILDNLIVDGSLQINNYKSVINENNLILKKDGVRPLQAKAIILPNKYDTSRAHLAIYNFEGTAKVSVPTGDFLKPTEGFSLHDPTDLHGPAIFTGKCAEGKITVPASGEFTVYVVKKTTK